MDFSLEYRLKPVTYFFFSGHVLACELEKTRLINERPLTAMQTTNCAMKAVDL